MENYLQTVYDEDSHPKTSYPNELAKYIISRYSIQPKAKLLDVGCGRGDFLQAFRCEGLMAYGVDMPIDSALGGDIYTGGVDFERGALPYADESFDIIFSKSVLEHIHNPENLMRECRRILKRDGIIISMVPDWQSCMYIFYDDCTHVQPYTVTGLRDLLRMFKFRNVESEVFYQLPVIWRNPWLKFICKILQLQGPVKNIKKNKFHRFSRELMLLASGRK